MGGAIIFQYNFKKFRQLTLIQSPIGYKYHTYPGLPLRLKVGFPSVIKLHYLQGTQNQN